MGNHIINPQCAFAARVAMCVSVCVCVPVSVTSYSLATGDGMNHA